MAIGISLVFCRYWRYPLVTRIPSLAVIVPHELQVHYVLEMDAVRL